jgi:FATC domain
MWTLQQEMQGEAHKTSAKQPENLPEPEADRALQMVKRKLSSRLSAEADVRNLIFEATDEGNLSRMYYGTRLFIILF